MNRRQAFLSLCLTGVGLILITSCAKNPSLAHQDNLSLRLEQKNLTIMLTDSGLGGLSVMADVANVLHKLNAYDSVRLLFVNALFSSEGGYNSLNNSEEKRRILDSALSRMETLYRPDLLLIACNTLSIIYPKTSFSSSTQIPVQGIIDTGVAMMAEKLKLNPESRILLFGTQTTIQENTHKKMLVSMGFLPDRIITQACPDLVLYIEKDFDGDETEMLIQGYVDEALQKTGELVSPLFVCFGCTHYGYALDLWQKAFQELGKDVSGFINPNGGMARLFDRPALRDRFDRTKIEARIISMVPIPEETVSSLAEWLFLRSPEISRALRRYENIPDLFPWKPFVDRHRKLTESKENLSDDSIDDLHEWD